MQKVDSLFSPKPSPDSEQLTIIDLIILRILINFNFIVVAAIAFLLLTLIQIPFFQALGWVGYIVSTILIIVVQLRFSKYRLAALLLLTLLLNSIQFSKIF